MAPATASGDLAAMVRAMLEAGGDRRLAVRLDPVDEAVARRLLGPHPPAGIGQLAQHALRDQIAEPLQRAEIGGDRDVDLGDLEEGVGGGDAQVAGAGEVDSGADAAAMDRRDHRRARLLDRAERVLQPFDMAQPRLGRAAGIGGWARTGSRHIRGRARR